MTHEHIKKLKVWGGLLLILCIAIPPLFLHLGDLPLQLWDESRLGISAQEMMHPQNILVVNCGGGPDMWNVKPPLMIWLQAISLHIWGMSEWSTRLPGAVASVCTCITLYLFFVWKKAPLLGFIAAGVLITSAGFITLHCSRTGDYDPLLTWFTTAYCLSFFAYMQDGRYKYLYTTFIFLTLATFTKSVAALLFLPALLVFTVYKGQLRALLTCRHFYIGSAGFITFIAGYYLLREHYGPGYFKSVEQYELGGRYLQVLENNKGSFLYYYNNMVRHYFLVWCWLLIPGLVAGLFMDNKKYRDLTIYLVLLILVFFLIISSSQTKLFWYAMPIYPFLACIASLFIYFVFLMLQKKRALAILAWCLLPVIFILPYKDILALTTARPNIGKKRLGNELAAEYLHMLLHNDTTFAQVQIPYIGYQANLEWYWTALKLKTGSAERTHPERVVGDTIIVAFQDEVKKYVETHCQTTILQTYYNVTVYNLNGKRQ